MSEQTRVLEFLGGIVLGYVLVTAFGFWVAMGIIIFVVPMLK